MGHGPKCFHDAQSPRLHSADTPNTRVSYVHTSHHLSGWGWYGVKRKPTTKINNITINQPTRPPTTYLISHICPAHVTASVLLCDLKLIMCKVSKQSRVNALTAAVTLIENQRGLPYTSDQIGAPCARGRSRGRPGVCAVTPGGISSCRPRTAQAMERHSPSPIAYTMHHTYG